MLSGKILLHITFLIALILCGTVMADLTTGKDETAQLPYWQWQTSDISVRFVQRLPDQTRAYFAGRGFNKEDTNYISQHCIFQTIFKNISTAAEQKKVEYDLSQWQIRLHNSQNKALNFILREDWKKIWQQRDAKLPQKIAFEWSLLPTRQIYYPADYNWGMLVSEIPHGATFDLQIQWKINNRPFQATLSNLQCAEDVYVPPQP